MGSSTALYKQAQTSIADQANQRKAGLDRKQITCNKPVVKGFFLPYQTKWIQDKSLLVVGAKGRRTGITFAESFRAFYDAVRGISNSFYTSYNYHACKAFIAKVAKWAKAFNIGYQYLTDQVLIDNNSISVFKVVFNNGYFVEALPGNPENLRDKEGTILIDEAGFRLDLEAVLDAAMAVNVWGYQVKIWSTHNGEGHEFNKLCESVKENPKKGSYHFIPFKEGIHQGLFKKICEVKNEEWTEEKELEFISSLYERYGDGASEELDALPRKYGNNRIFKEEYFTERDYHQSEIDGALKIRYWDLATSTKEGSFYTATVLAAIINDTMVILEADAEHLDASDGDDWIERVARKDDIGTITLIEKEPGSSGEKYVNYMKNRLSFRYVDAYAPSTNKVLRALPLIPALKTRNIVLRKGFTNKERFVSAVCDFDGTPRPLTNDWTDCLSGLFDYSLSSVGNWIGE